MTTKKKGFATLNKEKMKKIAKAGGKASQSKKQPKNRWTPEQARAASRAYWAKYRAEKVKQAKLAKLKKKK